MHISLGCVLPVAFVDFFNCYAGVSDHCAQNARGRELSAKQKQTSRANLILENICHDVISNKTDEGSFCYGKNMLTFYWVVRFFIFYFGFVLFHLFWLKYHV